MKNIHGRARNIARVGVNQLRREKKGYTIVRSPVPCMFLDILFWRVGRIFMAYPRRQILDTRPRPKGITI